MNRHAPDVAKRRVCDVEEARLFIQCQTVRQTVGRQSRQPLRCRMQAWTQTPDPGQIGAASTIVEVERPVSYSDNTADERISPNNRANNRSGGTCCRGRQWSKHLARINSLNHPCFLHQLLLDLLNKNDKQPVLLISDIKGNDILFLSLYRKSRQG